MFVRPREERLERVQHDALRSDGIDGEAEPDEEALEVVLARLLDLVSLDVDVIHGEHLPLDQLVEVEAKRADILRQFLRGLLEGHEDAGFVILHRAFDEELHAEERLAAPGVAADEGGPPFR